MYTGTRSYIIIAGASASFQASNEGGRFAIISSNSKIDIKKCVYERRVAFYDVAEPCCNDNEGCKLIKDISTPNDVTISIYSDHITQVERIGGKE